MSVYMKVLKAIRIYCETKIKFAFTTNHFCISSTSWKFKFIFLPYSGQWWTPSNLTDLLGIETVAPFYFFFAWIAASKDDGFPRLLTLAFPARSKESAILILKSLITRQLLFSFPVEQQSRRYRSHDWSTIISKQ